MAFTLVSASYFLTADGKAAEAKVSLREGRTIATFADEAYCF